MGFGDPKKYFVRQKVDDRIQLKLERYERFIYYFTRQAFAEWRYLFDLKWERAQKRDDFIHKLLKGFIDIAKLVFPFSRLILHGMTASQKASKSEKGVSAISIGLDSGSLTQSIAETIYDHRKGSITSDALKIPLSADDILEILFHQVAHALAWRYEFCLTTYPFTDASLEQLAFVGVTRMFQAVGEIMLQHDEIDKKYQEACKNYEIEKEKKSALSHSIQFFKTAKDTLAQKRTELAKKKAYYGSVPGLMQAVLEGESGKYQTHFKDHRLSTLFVEKSKSILSDRPELIETLRAEGFYQQMVLRTEIPVPIYWVDRDCLIEKKHGVKGIIQRVTQPRQHVELIHKGHDKGKATYGYARISPDLPPALGYKPLPEPVSEHLAIMKKQLDAHRPITREITAKDILNYQEAVKSQQVPVDMTLNDYVSMFLNDGIPTIAVFKGELSGQINDPPSPLDLSALDFRGVDFSGASFISCNLAGTIFDHAQLVHTHFENIEAETAISFRGAYLVNCQFQHTKLQQAHFENAIVLDTTFQDCDLTCIKKLNVKKWLGNHIDDSSTTDEDLLASLRGYQEIEAKKIETFSTDLDRVEKILALEIEKIKSQTKKELDQHTDRLGEHEEKIASHEERLISIEGIQARNLLFPPKKTLHADIKSWGLPPAHPKFTGRKIELEMIRKDLHSKTPDLISQNESITGLAGIGKTTLAIQYAHSMLNDKDYDFVLWIEAGEEYILMDNFISIARDLGIDHRFITEKALIEQVYRELFKMHAKILVIFDNAIDYKILIKYLPPIQEKIEVHLLFTTWKQELSPNINNLVLRAFSQQDAREYIKKYLANSSDTEADQLAELLYQFPLALTQAVAYIHRSCCTIAKYIELYLDSEKNQRKLLQYQIPDDPYEETIYTTWNLSLNAIQKNHPDSFELCSCILNTSVYLYSKNIPKRLLKELAKDEIDLFTALEHLSEYSLIDLGLDYINIHQMVQRIMLLQQKSIQEEDKATSKTSEAWLENAGNILIITYPKEKYDKADYTYTKMLIPHFESVLAYYEPSLTTKELSIRKLKPASKLQIAELSICVGNSYGNFEYREKQKNYLENALSILKEHYSENHIQIARVLEDLGIAYRALGDAKTSEIILKSALDILLENSTYAEEIANAQINLANTYIVLGDITKARQLLDPALEILCKKYNPDDIQIANALMSLGAIHYYLEDISKAIECWEKALDIQRKKYGAEHINITITLNNLAVVYGKIGYKRQQKKILKYILHIQKQYELEDTAIQKTQINLAETYRQLGNPRKSQILLEPIIKQFEQKHGREHIKLAEALVNLGITYRDLGKSKEGQKLLQRALKIQIDFFETKDHPQIAKTMNSLANTYGNLEEIDKKIKLLEEALKIQQKIYEKDNPEIAMTLCNLANAYYIKRDFLKTKELSERALKIFNESNETNPIDKATILDSLAIANIELENISIAIELLKESLKIKKIFYQSEENISIAGTLVNLATAYGKKGDIDRKIEILNRAFNIQKSFYEPEKTTQMADILYNLANAYGKKGDIVKTLKLLEEALLIYEHHYGKMHTELISILKNIANAYSAPETTTKKIEVLERILKIQEHCLKKNHFDLASTLNNLAISYGHVGDLDKKKALLERAFDIEKINKRERHPETGSILANLADANFKLRNFAEAKEQAKYAFFIFSSYPEFANSQILTAITDFLNRPELIEHPDLSISRRTHGKS